MKHSPSTKQVDDELERIIKAPAVPVVIRYKDWRPKLDLHISEGDWAQSQSIRARMRKLLKG